jgi:hypothetical protein
MQQSDVAIAGGRILSVGYAGSAFLSNDNGVSWEALSFAGVNSSFSDVNALPDAGGNEGFAMVSAEGGFYAYDPVSEELSDYPTGVTNTLNAIEFVDASVGLIVGAGGQILRTTSGGMPGNTPPGDFVLQQPEDEATVLDWEVEFAWSESVDNDGDDLTYALTIDPEFAVAFTVEISNDTTELVDFSGYTIEPGQEYEVTWEMLVTDGTDTTYATNAPFGFTLIPPVEGPPGPFERLAPEDETYHEREPVELVWTTSLDPNGFETEYNLYISARDENDIEVFTDQVLGLVDTTHSYNFAVVTQNPSETLDLVWEVEAVNEYGATEPTNGAGLFYLNPLTAVGDGTTGVLPETFAVGKPYPNPFNARATISVSLPSEGRLSVTLFDVNGRRVGELFDGFGQSGIHTYSIDGSSLSSGSYFVQVGFEGHESVTRRLHLVK